MKGGTTILSPHPDDAAFSLGGAVAQGYFPAPVSLVTLFGRSAYSKQDGFAGDPEAVTRRRRREDETFASRFGLALSFFELPEAALRGEPLFVSHPLEPLATPAGLEEALSQALNDLRPDRLLLPLGLGGHRDHLLTRRAALPLARRRGLDYAYYEDLPYAAWVSPRRLRRHLGTVEAALVPEEIPLGSHREAKLRSLHLYPSQVGWRELLSVRWHHRRGRSSVERIWRP
jgi:LmbE family N-acetylglucosaminyl deacetylase